MHIERFSNWRCFAHFKSDRIFVQRIMAYKYFANYCPSERNPLQKSQILMEIVE